MSAFFYSLYYKFFALFISTLMIVSPSFRSKAERLETDKQNQLTHIEELQNAYLTVEKNEVNESSFFDGNLEEVLNSGIKFNELTYIGTHNSYQRYIGSESGIGCGGDEGGTPVNLSDQLDAGLRNLEIDIETVVDETGTHFVCIHSPLLDMNTNCYSFEKALEELKIWSDNNPKHLPISVIIEPKKVFVPLENMEFFSLKAANELDKRLSEILGDTLLTPSDVLGDFGSFKEMREADAWPQVRDTLGKIAVILHPCKVTDDYIKQDETIKTQSMFPMLRIADKNRSYASFLLINDAKSLLKDSPAFADGNFVIRTRADLYGRYSETTFNTAALSAANIISTDYPCFANCDSDKYVAFNGNKTVKVTNFR